MSSALYRLAHVMTRHARLAVTACVFFLIATGVMAFGLGGTLQNDFSIPGTESQDGMVILKEQFPEVSGASAQLVVRAKDGTPINTYREAIEGTLSQLEKIDGVLAVTNPFKPAPGSTQTMVSHNGRFALIQIQLRQTKGLDYSKIMKPVRATANAMADANNLDLDIGGTAFTQTEIEMSGFEGIGVILALLVLAVMFHSLIAAGIPILSALIGVGITMAIIISIAAFTPISTTTPTLAIMLGLAVGIDYALFIVHRHREQLGNGVPVADSIAFALATSGGAVLFAGLTVVIALCGLLVANIPFLTGIGLCAAIGVGLAVVVALSGLPALLMLLGERLRPRKTQQNAHASLVADHDAAPPPQDDGYEQTLLPRLGSINRWWVGITTTYPIITIFCVVVLVGFMAYPAKDLTLALPDNGTAKRGSEQRITYDLVAKEFGAGANGPLIIMANIINTTDPIGVVKDLSADVGAIQGIDRIQLATPNRTGTIGAIVAVPYTAQDDPQTAELVHRLRSHAHQWQTRYGISDIRITGFTAVTIDVSQRLADALLPFGIVVVGLSLVLLLIVFRSLLVPVKATIGYIFSVSAAFGVTSLVFTWGWGNDALDIGHIGSVICFMPIVIMGVLFGLAMDYEVFLVSRMREEYVRTRQAKGSIIRGFGSSAPVVTAAALIMISVFASFIPGGSYYVQPMALGLTVGVGVDAFLVRMTFVPAFMALLKNKTWAIPSWLDKRLPSFDVEGEAIVRTLSYQQWERTHGKTAIRLDNVVVHDPPMRKLGQKPPATKPNCPSSHGLSAIIRPGVIVGVSGSLPAQAALLALIGGRVSDYSGDAFIDGHHSRDELGHIHRHVMLITQPLNHLIDYRRYPIAVYDCHEEMTGEQRRQVAYHLRSSVSNGVTVVMGLDKAHDLRLEFQELHCEAIYPYVEVTP
ncbi:MAG: MMPL family transporter [Actinomycetaceae bacterium]|nr:MMPL family transporter [Actinomycetaceae bacterium]